MALIFDGMDETELLVLHRALMEAKFTPTPYDVDLAGSAILAAVANRVVDALSQQAAQHERTKVEQWHTWRQIQEHRREWQVALARISESRFNI